MADQESKFVIAFDGNAGDLNNVLAALKRQIRSDVGELKTLTGKVELFGNLEQQSAQLAAAFTAAKAKVDELRAAIEAAKAAGSPIGANLTKELKDAEKALTAATKAVDSNAASLKRLETQLVAAGVNTKSLASEQIRLAAAAQAAQQAEQLRQAGQTLGVRSTRDLTAEIAKANAAFQLIKNSATSSNNDIANAFVALKTRTKELNAEINVAAKSSFSLGTSLTDAASHAILPLLGVTAVAHTLVSAFEAGVEAAHQFHQALAEIGAATTLSQEEIHVLGEDARKLAAELGLNLPEALKALKDILKAGIDPDKALQLLRDSAIAAKGGVQNLDDAVQTSLLLVNGFGVAVDDAANLLDKITVSAHHGGPSLAEWAKNGGQALEVAKLTGQSFDGLNAALTVTTARTHNAEKAFADVTKIMARLNTDAVQAKLRGLGIESTDLVDVFTQLDAKLHETGDEALSVSEVLGAGLTGAGAKGVGSLAALADSNGRLAASFEDSKNAAGAAQKAFEATFDTPRERAARFNAALEESKVKLGEAAGAGSRLVAVFTRILTVLNAIPTSLDVFDQLLEIFQKGTIFGTAFSRGIEDLARAFFGIPASVGKASEGTRAYAEQMRLAGEETAKTKAQVEQASAKFKEAFAALTADITALQTAFARDIADANTRADAQIAALDRGKAAEAATARATFEIKKKLAEDTFAILEASEKAITKATEDALAAREREATRSGDKQKQIDGDTAAFAISAIEKQLAAWQKLYGDLVNLAQTESARARGFEDARVSIVQKAEDAIRAIRIGSLSGLDAYVAKMAEIDRLVSEGRKAATAGDAAAAQRFFDQAIAASNGLTTVVKEDGTVLITQLQAATDKETKLKQAISAANETLGGQGDAATKAAETSKAKAEEVRLKIVDLQGTYDKLKKAVAEGLAFKIDTDQKSVSDAFALLAELTKPRTAVITIKTVTESGAPAAEFNRDPAQLAGGGLVQAVRRTVSSFNRGGDVVSAALAPLRNVLTQPIPVRWFASGGPVFSGRKVPGSGSGDTFGATLRAGSFVVRKAATEHYGDGLMGQLNAALQRFAIGGIADRIIFGGPATRLLNPGGGGRQFGNPGTTGAERDEYSDTLKKLRLLVEHSRFLPRSNAGMNIIDWAGKILGHFDRFSVPHKNKIRDLLASSFEVEGGQGWLKLVDDSVKKHIPVVMSIFGFNAGIQDLANDVLGDLKGLTLAGGGPAPGTDTVPAMLTPGEWVIQKPAVEKFGAGFMHLINSMSIPKPDLEAMFAPPRMPRRYATGGEVGFNDPVVRAPRAGGGSAPASGGLTVHIHTDATNLLSPDAVRRHVVPVLDDLYRRSR